MPLIELLLAEQSAATAWRLGEAGIRDLLTKDSVGRLLVLLYNDHGQATGLSKTEFYGWGEDAEVRSELALVVAGRRTESEEDTTRLADLVAARLPNNIDNAPEVARAIAQDAIALAPFALKSASEIGRYLVAKVEDLDLAVSRLTDVAEEVQAEAATAHAELLDGQDLLSRQLGESTAKLLEAISAVPREIEVVRFVRSDWGPEGTERALARLGERDAEVLRRLQEAAGDPVSVDALRQLVDQWPTWLRAGPIEAFGALARLLEQTGPDWSLASRMWEEAARAAETASHGANLLVRSAIAANLGKDESRGRALIDEARETDPTAQRLVLEEASDLRDPDEQLDRLSNLTTDDPELHALIEAQRSLAYLLKGDCPTARYHLEQANQRAPWLQQLQLVRINVIVQEARLAVANDQAVDASPLQEAVTTAHQLRARLQSAERHEESGRLLMLICDAEALLGNLADAVELLKTATNDEISAGHNAEVLAETALRFSEYRRAIDLLRDYHDTEASVRQRAAAIVFTGSSEAVIEALSTLRGIALGDSEEAMLAGANRLLSCAAKPQLDWDEDVARKLIDAGGARLAIGARAMQLARKTRYEDALEVLNPYLNSLWALESSLHVAAMKGNSEELAAAATAVLDAGPDQPMLVACGTALREAGDPQRAAQILIAVAHNPGAPPATRSDAYHTLLLIVANDQGDWHRAETLWQEWRDLNTRDGRISAWYARLVLHTE